MLVNFSEAYNIEGAQDWLQGIERIIRAMVYMYAHKVTFVAFVLDDEVKFLWENTHARMEVEVKAIM
ncbi:hypothetical protein CR513_28360, partial [Mucuna pruriens]